jgi:hypothetical protein
VPHHYQLLLVLLLRPLHPHLQLLLLMLMLMLLLLLQVVALLPGGLLQLLQQHFQGVYPQTYPQQSSAAQPAAERAQPTSLPQPWQLPLWSLRQAVAWLRLLLLLACPGAAVGWVAVSLAAGGTTPQAAAVGCPPAPVETQGGTQYDALGQLVYPIPAIDQ